MEGYGDFEIPARFSGVVAIFNARRSIDLILQLQPRIGTIYVVSGAGTAEKMMLANTLAQGLQYQDRLQFVALSQLPFEQMLARVAEISGNAAILFLSMQIDVTGKLPEPSVAAGEIGRVAQVPVYGMFDTYSGSGITGGFLIDHEKLGRRAADIAIPILQGQAPTGNFSNEPIGENSFDWRQLKRWGIDERSLPAGSRVEFKEFSPWELYKWQLIGGICFIVLPSLLVVILLVNRSRRKQVEEELREANENLEDRLAILTRSLGNAKESSTSQNEEVVAVNEELITQYEEKA